MIQKVTVASLRQALCEQFINVNKFNAIIVLIDPQRASIVDAYYRNLKINNCIVYFYDTCDKDVLFHPTIDIVDRADDFINLLHSKSEDINLLVHCYAGKCRSAAVALMAILRLYNFNEELALQHLFQIRKKAFPNASILELIDLKYKTCLEKTFYNFIVKNKITYFRDNRYLLKMKSFE